MNVDEKANIIPFSAKLWQLPIFMTLYAQEGFIYKHGKKKIPEKTNKCAKTHLGQDIVSDFLNYYDILKLIAK